MVGVLNEIKEYKVKIKVLTGLHIGGSKENLDIGGIDSPVIKIRNIPVERLKESGKSDEEINKILDEFKSEEIPYIPGSSVKGKMRSLLEYKFGAYSNDGKPATFEIAKDDENKRLLVNLFGSSDSPDDGDVNATRLIVRDFYPTIETLKKWKEYKESFYEYTEEKVENVVNRIKGTAESPRRTERVLPGSEFEGSFVLLLFDSEKEKDYKKLIEEGIKLIKYTYLGGMGTRGYGQVEIKIEKEETVWKNTKDGEGQ